MYKVAIEFSSPFLMETDSDEFHPIPLVIICLSTMLPMYRCLLVLDDFI